MRTLFRLFMALAACLSLGAGSAQAQKLYGADGAGGNPATNLYTLDPASGAILTTVGPIGFAVTGMAFHPTTGILYGSTGGTGANINSIVRINSNTGAGTLVGTTGLAGPVADITFRADGTLFGWSEDTDDLVTINLVTGTATVVGPSGLSTAGSGIAFSPGGVLFFTGDDDDGDLTRLNPATGAPMSAITMTGGTGGSRINALAFGPGGVLFGSDQGGGGSLITINTTTGAITILGVTVAGLDAIAFGPPSVSVPTMSEWALLLMALLMAAAVFWANRKRA